MLATPLIARRQSVKQDTMSIQTNTSWIQPWSKAVHKAAEEEKRFERRKSSFMAGSQHKNHLNEFRSSVNDVFQFAEKLPSPTILQRVFFSPHPDDIAYSHYGTASRKPRCCGEEQEQQEQQHEEKRFETITVNKFHSSLRVHRDDSGVGLLSPSLSSSSKFSDEATLVATPSSFSSASSSTSSDSRRNSVNNVKHNHHNNQQNSSIDGQNALIVTVFSKSRCANGEIGARLNRNVEDTTTLRTYEDEEFARSIGCDLLQLGFPDSSARDEPSRRPDLAELAMKQTPGTKISTVDHYIYEDVRKSLEPIVWMAIRAGAKIHLPLGVGCHVDHWMVRVAVLSILDEIQQNLSNPILMKKMMENESLQKLLSSSNLVDNQTGLETSLHERCIFYEDLPYADAQTNSHVESLAKSVLPLGTKAKLIHLTEQDWSKKRAAILAYASQMKPTILPSLYNHATRLAQMGTLIDPDFDTSQPHLAAERIWIVDSELRRKALLLQQEKDDE